ncbi:MAG: hypothetical protein V2A79_14740 [Planctomycetota bacterium]
MPSQAYRRNYEAAFGHAEPKPGTSRFVMRGGRLAAGSALRRDNHEIRSLSSGVVPHQVPEAQRKVEELGLEGVRYDPTTGEAIYRNRQCRLKALKAFGFHDKDEIRG